MTNKEIAEQLGISPATLSLIINHKPGISESRRNDILNQLINLGYGDLIKPVEADRNHNLALVIYKRNGKIVDLHPFFLLMMGTIESRAQHFDYNVILFTIDDQQAVAPQIERLRALNPSGIVLVATEMEQNDLLPLMKLNIPLVAIDNRFSALPVTSVSIDNQMGTYQTVAALLKAGYHKIGYLRSSAQISSFAERARGFQLALEEAGIDFNSVITHAVSYTEDGSYRDFSQLLAQKSPLPEVFICDDDTIAVGAQRAARDFNLKVPDDLSFVGFNNRPNTTAIKPQLSTVNVNREELAVTAINELVQLISQKDAGQERIPRKIQISTAFVQRDSTRH